MSDTTDAAAPAATADDAALLAGNEQAVDDSPTGDATEGDDQAATEEEIEELEFQFGSQKLKYRANATVGEIREQLAAFTRGVQSDYTKKTQEVAEHRKALDAEAGYVQALGNLRNETLTLYSQGQQVKAALEELQKVDLPALWQSNPDQARQVSDLINLRSSQLNTIVADLTAAENKAFQQEQQRAASLEAMGRERVMKEIPAFDPAPVIDYAVKTYGVSQAEASKWGLNPVAAVMAYKAMKYDEAQAKTQAAAKAAAKPPPPPAVPSKSPGGSPGKPDGYREDMTDEQFRAWRAKQQAARRR